MSHIATALSASVRMDDYVAAKAPVAPVSASTDDTTQHTLTLSDFSSAAALVDSKPVRMREIMEVLWRRHRCFLFYRRDLFVFVI